MKANSWKPKMFAIIAAVFFVSMGAMAVFVSWRSWDIYNSVASQSAVVDSSSALSQLGVQSGQLSSYATMAASSGGEAKQVAYRRLLGGLNDWQAASDALEKKLGKSPPILRRRWAEIERVGKPLSQDLWGIATLVGKKGSPASVSAVLARLGGHQKAYTNIVSSVQRSLDESITSSQSLKNGVLVLALGCVAIAACACFGFFMLYRTATGQIRKEIAKHLSERETHFAARAQKAADEGLRELQINQRKLENQAEALQIALTRAQEVDQLKTTFLANMSHEIRTPMNHVIGMSELLSQTELTPNQREWLRTIISSGNQLVRLIKDILDLSAVEAGKLSLDPRPMNLKEVVTDAVRPFEEEAKQKGLALAVWHAAGMVESIVADPVRVGQIITNLLSNAVKYTSAGRIDVAVETIDRSEGQLDFQIGVKDTGIGIEASRLPSIFESFTQAGDGLNAGTGIGLTIVKQLTDLMGGTVDVRSHPGYGSEFVVLVPAKKATGSESAEA